MIASLPNFGTAVFTLFGVAAVALAGVAATAFWLHLRRRELARRVDLVRPWTSRSAGHPIPGADPSTTALRDTGLDPASRQLRHALVLLGIPQGLVPLADLAVRPALAVVLSVAVWFFAPLVVPFLEATLWRLLAASSAGVFGWLVPGMILDALVTRRKNAVVSGLPNALELLVICSEGGLALADSIDRIVVELRGSQPELAEELALTAADLKVLPTQDQALARLAERVNAPIVRSVVTSLSQTMRYGTPLAKALRVVASDLRNEALIRMEGRANELPALMTIPMILFILPTLLLVILGPAALQTFDVITH